MFLRSNQHFTLNVTDLLLIQNIPFCFLLLVCKILLRTKAILGRKGLFWKSSSPEFEATSPIISTVKRKREMRCCGDGPEDKRLAMQV